MEGGDDGQPSELHREVGDRDVARSRRVRASRDGLGAGPAFPIEPLTGAEAVTPVDDDVVTPADPDVSPSDLWVWRVVDAARETPDDELSTPESADEPRAEDGSGSSFGAAPTEAPLPELPDAVCVDGTDVDDLIELFDRREPLLGADYQRAYPLPDGRMLWLFQDGFVATAHGPELLHNVGLLQSGSCFQLLRGGTDDQPRSYLLAELTDRFDRWFWPLGGDLGTDGRLHVFVAEMLEHGSAYLVHTEPVATWLVTIDPSTLDVVDARLAPDPSPTLYGWSVVSDERYTYLYAQCHRQFGWDPLWFAPDVLAHDYDCSADVTVARVPRGVFSEQPEYWDGAGWVDDPDAAVPVVPTEGRPVNPTQVARWNGRFVAVTKVGDWWGDTIALDVAPQATGPWSTYHTVQVAPECAGCATYFASIVPYGADEWSFVVGLSGNAWSGALTEHYTPTFLRVPAPPLAA